MSEVTKLPRIQDDHFAIGDEIFNQLVSAFDADGVKIIYWADSSVQNIIRQFSPAITVGYLGDLISQVDRQITGGGKRQINIQRWMATIIMKDARSPAAGSESIKTSGPIASKIIKTLQGLEVRPGIKLRRYAAGTIMFEQGFLIVPFIFGAEIPL